MICWALLWRTQPTEAKWFADECYENDVASSLMFMSKDTDIITSSFISMLYLINIVNLSRGTRESVDPSCLLDPNRGHKEWVLVES